MSISGIGSPENSQLSANYAPDESRISEQQQQSDFLDSLMISKDKDSNGVLSLDEAGLSKEKFSKLDADGNGQVSPSEVQAVLEKMQKEKGELGKLDVQMQQVEEIAAKAPPPASQMVGFEESGLDEDMFATLDSDGDGKVSKEAADLLKIEKEEGEKGEEGGVFSEALSEFQKNFFRKEEDEEEKDLNKDGVVSVEEEELAEQQAAKVTGVNAKESEEPTTDTEPQGKRFSARHMAGIRAYQNQASEFFAAASQSSVKFQY